MPHPIIIEPSLRYAALLQDASFSALLAHGSPVGGPSELFYAFGTREFPWKLRTFGELIWTSTDAWAQFERDVKGSTPATREGAVLAGVDAFIDKIDDNELLDREFSTIAERSGTTLEAVVLVAVLGTMRARLLREKLAAEQGRGK